MEPGQVAVQTGVWVGSMATGIESQALVGVEVPWSHRASAVAWVGVQRHSDGSFDPRDATVAAMWIPVSEPNLMVRVQPGLSIPTGGIGGGLAFTPLSTASVDPWMAADVVAGSTWLASLGGIVRVPVYQGWDRIRQGPFLRVDLRGARRVGVTVPFLGLSGVRQMPSAPEGAAPDFGEVATTAGAVVNLAERWSLTAQLRVPLVVTEGVLRRPSGGLAVRAVVGSAPEGHEH
ncbi:MAG: hypothetical protein KTR31_06925 [Myxococcales bacterium]|nr:hypothetical protein [Myxococcales bacterium]